jgi:hypothetical protein
VGTWHDNIGPQLIPQRPASKFSEKESHFGTVEQVEIVHRPVPVSPDISRYFDDFQAQYAFPAKNILNYRNLC